MTSLHEELSDDEREALGTLRLALSPSQEERARTFEGVMLGLGFGGSGAGQGATEPRIPRLLRARSSVLKLAGSAVLSFGLGWVSHAGLSSSERTVTQTPSDAVLLVETTPPNVPPPVSPPPLVEESPAPSSSTVSSPRPKTPKTRKSQAPPSELYHEMDRVRQAQTALSQGRPLIALGILSDLDKEQPKGALGAERAMIKILSLCGLGRTEEAEEKVRSSFPKGIQADYRARLQATCAKTALGGASKN